MEFIYTIFIALANNLDNISVRIAYRIRGVKISALKNLWISIITFFISSFAAFFGTTASSFLNKSISSILSMVLLIAIGLWIMLEPCLKKEHNNEIQTDTSEEKSIYNILINWIFTLFFGAGIKEVLVGETLVDINPFSGKVVLSHISAVKYSLEKFEIVNTFACKLTFEFYGFTKPAQETEPLPTRRGFVWPTKYLPSIDSDKETGMLITFWGLMLLSNMNKIS